MGFTTYKPFEFRYGINEMDMCLLTIEAQREALPFDIDGAVIKYNDCRLWSTIGYSNTAPKHSIAYKFKAERRTTEVRDITWQVGRLGAITPVAELVPIEVAGSTISRATLHNVSELERLNISAGDIVYIEKAGDVIPKIVSIAEKRGHCSVQIPTHCPCCGTQLIYTDSGKALRCTNQQCREQQLGQLEHWCSKKAMNIKGVSRATLEALYDNNMIAVFTHLYGLSAGYIQTLHGMGEVSATNCYNAVQASISRPWKDVLYGMGIRGIGQRQAEKIAQNYSLQELVRGWLNEDVSEIIKQNISDYFNSEDGTFISDFLVANSFGFNTSAENSIKISSNKLEGDVFIFTGTLQTMTRTQAEDMAKAQGAVIASGISKNVTYVVAGEKAGSKLDKAKKLNIEILTETEFLEMV